MIVRAKVVSINYFLAYGHVKSVDKPLIFIIFATGFVLSAVPYFPIISPLRCHSPVYCDKAFAIILYR